MDDSTAGLRHPDSIRQAVLRALLPTLLLVLNVPDATHAQVVTNITPTTIAPLNLGTNVNTVGPTTQITGGTRPGNGTNLFHSFDSFTLGTGNVAHFMNDMQLPTTNIVGRVIGGELSTVDGTLRTNNPLNAVDPMNFGAANLWLVNPSGLLLGPNARVEVGGSVSMSTANYLRFEFEGTSALFDMLSSPASLGQLSVAPVVAFGFVGSNPGAITVQGSQFSVTDGQSISLVGGNISIGSGTAEGGTAQPVQLSAPNGKIQLASAASTGEFDAATLQALPNSDGTSFTSFGSVSLALGSHINVSGASTVFIKGGQIVLSVNDAGLTTSQTSGEPETISFRSGSSIVTSNSGTDPGADVQITVGAVQMDEAMIQSINSGDLDGGNISVNATTVGFTNGASVLSSTGLDFTTVTRVGSGNGGNVTVQGLGGVGSPADLVAFSDSSNITSNTFGPGKGGNAELTAGTVTMQNFSSISTFSTGGDGVGGDVVLNVGTGSLTGGASILSQTENSTPGAGVGGNVIIQGLQGAGSAAELVDLSGDSSLSTQTIGSSDGGRVAITSKSLTMDGAATTVLSEAFGVGLGGEIVVNVQQASLSGGARIKTQTSLSDVPDVPPGPMLTVQGLLGKGSMADSIVLSGFGSGIVSDSVGAGHAGDVTVHAKTINMTDGAVIQGGAPNTSAAGGNVTLEADSVAISSGSHISSQASHADSGQVTITANTFSLNNAAITTSTSLEGRGGDVVLDVGSASLSNGSTINSSSVGPQGNAGNAGNITIQSGSTVVMNDSSITTEASNASGGQIVINAPEMVQLINSKISTSVEGSATDSDGGNITIDPQFVILQNSQIIAQANAGAGGAINVTAGVFLADPNSVVDASSKAGPQGTVNIQSPVQNLGEQLTPLSQQFSSAAALLAQRCAARVADGKFSTFVVAGREGLPAEPGGFLASPSWTAELLGSNLSGQYPHRLIAAVTDAFPEYDARPIQLAKYGDACR